jgi:hypothetical protein
MSLPTPAADRTCLITGASSGIGADVAIPGAPNRVAAGLGHLTPRRLLMPLLASRHPSLKD